MAQIVAGGLFFNIFTAIVTIACCSIGAQKNQLAAQRKKLMEAIAIYIPII
jgi:hypothetical protein